MREILFRGKTIATESEWVEGFYNHIPCGRFRCDEHCIQTIDEDGRIGQLYTVYDSTVGQYTGLTDKNGKKIFEGDILRYQRDMNRYELMVVVWNNSTASLVMAYSSDMYYYETLMNTNMYCEVTGNIHDNPELLEVI